MADGAALIWCPFASRADAEAAAGALLDAGLIACANILPGMISLYTWQGERGAGEEVAMLARRPPPRLKPPWRNWRKSIPTIAPRSSVGAPIRRRHRPRSPGWSRRPVKRKGTRGAGLKRDGIILPPRKPARMLTRQGSCNKGALPHCDAGLLSACGAQIREPFQP
jgi:hypothetical protein